jgi:hypothetical protein
VPRLNKRLEACVHFARFCTNHNLQPWDVAELIALADAAARAGARATYEPLVSEEPSRRRVESKAGALGLTVTWSGLAPTLYQGDRIVILPVIP